MHNDKPTDPRQLFSSIPHITPVEVNTYMTRVCASYPSNTKEYASLIAAFTAFQVLLNSNQLPLRTDGTIKHPGDLES